MRHDGEQIVAGDVSARLDVHEPLLGHRHGNRAFSQIREEEDNGRREAKSSAVSLETTGLEGSFSVDATLYVHVQYVKKR